MSHYSLMSHERLLSNTPHFSCFQFDNGIWSSIVDLGKCDPPNPLPKEVRHLNRKIKKGKGKLLIDDCIKLGVYVYGIPIYFM